jgi:hypothetical protein
VIDDDAKDDIEGRLDELDVPEDAAIVEVTGTIEDD